MKHLKTIISAALLTVGMGANAQSTNQGAGSASTVGSSEGWSTVWVEWNPSKFNIDIKRTEDQSFTGLSAGYSKAFPMSATVPLYAEAGFGLQYSYCTYDDYDADDYAYSRAVASSRVVARESSYDDEEVEVDFKMFSAKVPLSLIYRFDLPNSQVALMPYVGADLRYNLSAKLSDGDEDLNLFDKKEKELEHTWNRLQLGWHIGLKAHVGQNFLVGLSYGSDFGEIAKKQKISTTSLILGYTF